MFAVKEQRCKKLGSLKDWSLNERVPYNVILYDSLQHNVDSTVQHNKIYNEMMWNSMPRYNAIQYNTITKYDAIWYKTKNKYNIII